MLNLKVRETYMLPFNKPTEKKLPTNFVSIPAGHNRLPIEINVLGKFPEGSAGRFLDIAFRQQEKHPEFIEEYYESSAQIGKPNFPDNMASFTDPKFDPTAIYSFGIDTRDLVFHRHAGHRAIIGIAGDKGCILRFSLCTPEEAASSPQMFLEKMYVVTIPGGRMFSLRFNGTVYHQFSPVSYSDKAFFAVSVHTNEAGGLSGELLDKVMAQEGSIPLLTEPAPDNVLRLLQTPEAYQFATYIDLDCMD
jgi:hypothetical protein